MVGYTVTIYAARGKVWVMADWEHEGRATRLVHWYDREAGRSARNSLLALKLSVVDRQVEAYAHAPRPWPPGISRIILEGPQDWMNAADRTTVDQIMACIRAGGVAIMRRADEPPWPGIV